MVEKDPLPLCDAIRELRRVAGFTQAQLAVRMGTTARSIATWESGSMETLSPEVLLHLRHVALESEDEELAVYFDGLVLTNYADRDAVDAGAMVYSLLPGNLLEMQIVGELLRRVRGNDPAIKSIVDQISNLAKQRQAEEQKELDRIAAQRKRPQIKLRDRLMGREGKKK